LLAVASVFCFSFFGARVGTSIMGFVIIENVYSAFSIFVSYVTAYKSEILLYMVNVSVVQLVFYF